MATPRSIRLMDVGILNFAAGDQGRAVPGALGSDGGRSVYCGKGHLVYRNSRTKANVVICVPEE